MERILFGDNQFFGINHVSDEKARMQAVRFSDDRAVLKVISIAMNAGINTFMCTTHDRIASICDLIRNENVIRPGLNFFPCIPYAHKYANAVTELGIGGAISKFVPGNIFGSIFKGGLAVISKDYLSIMELLIDSEMKMFKKLETPVIFLQNVMTDLLLGLGMKDIFRAYYDYIIKKYNAEPGFITMNMPRLLNCLESAGIKNPIVCFSVNKKGFRMAGGKESYEDTLKNRKMRGVAMQVLAGGAIPANEAIEYVTKLPQIESILFGASGKENVLETISLINKYDAIHSGKNASAFLA